MASSGWQGQKDIQTSKYPHMALNLRIDSINHSGNNLAVSGVVRVICTSGTISYNNATVSYSGGSQTVPLYLSSGGSADVSFSVNIGGVSSGATSYTFSASLSAGSVASGSTSWVLSFDQSSTSPSGLSVTLVLTTYNTITGTATVSTYGNPNDANGRYVEFGIVEPSATTYFSDRRYKSAYRTNSATLTLTNLSDTTNAGFGDIVGMRPFKIACYANNTITENSIVDSTVYYTPPATGSLSYEATGSNNVYNVSYQTSTANNYSDYNASQYSAYLEYREAGVGEWQQLAQSTTLGANLTGSITILPQQAVEVRGYQIYLGLQSVVSKVVISNTNPATRCYGSVGRVAQGISQLYCSVNGSTTKVKKLYASVNGVATLIHQQTSSGGGDYTEP